MIHKRFKGFTLIELIVSVGLFSVVIVVAMSAYLSLISLERKARATNDVMTSLSFAVEAMSRSIRTGQDYNCNGGGNCINGASYFTFTDENGQTDTYLLKTDGTVGACLGSAICNSNIATTITDPRIVIQQLTFYTQGVGTAGADALLQPRVIISISGSVTPDPQSAPVSFSIESAATQRLIDL